MLRTEELHVEFADSTRTNADPMIGTLVLTKTPKSKRPAAGSHAISGSWQISKLKDFSSNALLFTFKVEGDNLAMTNPTGQSYSAQLDGTAAPYKGDPGIDSVSVVRLSERTLMETYKHGAKSVTSARVMIPPGSSNTINLIMTDLVQNTSVLFVADKQ